MDATFPHLGVYESAMTGDISAEMYVPVTVIWCTPDRHNRIVEHEFVPFHHLERRTKVRDSPYHGGGHGMIVQVDALEL